MLFEYYSQWKQVFVVFLYLAIDYFTTQIFEALLYPVYIEFYPIYFERLNC